MEHRISKFGPMPNEPKICRGESQSCQVEIAFECPGLWNEFEKPSLKLTATEPNLKHENEQERELHVMPREQHVKPNELQVKPSERLSCKLREHPSNELVTKPNGVRAKQNSEGDTQVTNRAQLAERAKRADRVGTEKMTKGAERA
eukprot:11637105-Ditylum_brightwellii.AAC.1